MTKYFIAIIMATTMSTAFANDAGPSIALPEAPKLGTGKTPTQVADDAVGATDDPISALGALYKAGKAGNWWGVFAVFLSLIIWGGRTAFKNRPNFKKWVLDNRWGSVAFTGLMSFLGMLTTKMMAGAVGDIPMAAPDLDDIKAALMFGALSIASWHGLIKPLLGKLKG